MALCSNCLQPIHFEGRHPDYYWVHDVPVDPNEPAWRHRGDVPIEAIA